MRNTTKQLARAPPVTYTAATRSRRCCNIFALIMNEYAQHDEAAGTCTTLLQCMPQTHVTYTSTNRRHQAHHACKLHAGKKKKKGRAEEEALPLLSSPKHTSSKATRSSLFLLDTLSLSSSRPVYPPHTHTPSTRTHPPHTLHTHALALI